MAGLTRRGLAAATVSLPLASSACRAPPPKGGDRLVVDDQSGLNATRVSRNITVPASAIPAGVPAVLESSSNALPVTVAGARHSMGGQSLPPAGGVAIALGKAASASPADDGVYRTGAGSRWRDVIARLDTQGLSPLVMQSNCDFSVGGSISVNAHGWAVPHGPLGSTVKQLRVMLADGSRVTCSPTQGPELFSACLGGYGLMGVLLDADLQAAPNVMLQRAQEDLAADDFAERFQHRVHAPDVEMAYGRLSMARARFMEEALLVSHTPVPDAEGALPPARTSGHMEGISRRIFRAQTGSEPGKQFRWRAEKHLAPSPLSTRNSLLNVSVKSFAPFDDHRTDILHEYFVPPAALNTFLVACRRLIPASDQDLLNCTLRWVEADPISLLSFAPEPRIALVMLFSQEKTPTAEADMTALTRSLIDVALSLGGSFYLPYRLHARPDQLRRAYPGLERFVALKRQWDPHLRFRNQMWDAWLARI